MKEEYEDFEQHTFYILDREDRYSPPGLRNVIIGQKFGNTGKYIKLRGLIKEADKVVIHFLYSMKLILFLNLDRTALKKCCWVLWGNDLYRRVLEKQSTAWHIRERLRGRVIRNLGAVTTTVPGDFDLIQKWYGTKAVYFENLMYPSHVKRALTVGDTKKASPLKIQIGNSASPTNYHEELIDKLADETSVDFQVFCPLSYGDESYKSKIIEYGRSKLGKKFIPMTQFMSFDEYSAYLSEIDIALMNHNRQQAMGNIIALLGMGKKVYIRSDITPWKYFEDKKIQLFDTTGDISLQRMEPRLVKQNISRVEKVFTKQRLKEGWDRVIESPWNQQ
jgi:hypothetical protein